MKFFPFLYAVLFGSMVAYLGSSIIFYKFNNLKFSEIPKRSFKNSFANEIDLSLILKKNIFDARVEKKIKPQRAEHLVRPQNKALSIKDYKLIGFVVGKHPMALFKKANEPVVIVDRNTPLQKYWYLKDIRDGVVYLYNKNTMEVQKFQIEKNKDMFSIFSQRNGINNIEKFKVSKRLLEKTTKDINRLFKEVRISPYFQGGSPVGYRIEYLSRDCILREIGLKRGDIIVSINGESTTKLSRMMEMFNELSDMTSINLDIIRNGKRKTIFVDIE